MNDADESPICCLRFDPVPWDNQTHIWKDRVFIKDSLPQLFHIPLPRTFASTIGRMWKTAQDAGAATSVQDFLLLNYDPTPWKGVFLMAVNHEVPGVENVKLSGTFQSKVFDGPHNAVPRYIKQMNAHLAQQGKVARNQYFYYTTCPRCATKYGHNYIVDFAELQG